MLSPTKQGFSVNTVNLWSSHGYEFCEEYLINGRAMEDGWINSEWLKSKFAKMRDEPDIKYVNKFLGLLAFEIWYRLFISNEMNSETTLT